MTLVPYSPLHRLKQLAPGLWTVDGGTIRMAYAFGKLPFTTRMVLAQLPEGGLWAWSPVELTDELQEEVETLGGVRHIVSPNAIHYANIPDWAKAWPKARVWASPGVRKRAASQGIDVSFTDDLGPEPPGDWAATLDQTIFEGSRLLREVVFFHRPSRTLILADLIENFEPDRVRGRWLPVVMRLAGVMDPDGQMPRDLRLTYIGNKRRARASLDRLLAWHPEKIVMAHGRIYERGGTNELHRAFRWLL